MRRVLCLSFCCWPRTLDLVQIIVGTQQNFLEGMKLNTVAVENTLYSFSVTNRHQQCTHFLQHLEFSSYYLKRLYKKYSHRSSLDPRFLYCFPRWLLKNILCTQYSLLLNIFLTWRSSIFFFFIPGSLNKTLHRHSNIIFFFFVNPGPVSKSGLQREKT